MRSAVSLRRRPLFYVSILASFLLCVGFLAFSNFFIPPRVCFGNVCLKVELADTQSERQRGLMFRQQLAPQAGMLFIFPRQDMWGFWMKNTLIPLDIIWLDNQGIVVDIVRDAMPVASEEPPTFKPVAAARYVLEANAGFAQRNDIRVGDRARFKWIFSLKQL
ncbi:MAG: DUF192 domain-containing protein [Candidatus Omnitrophota bacterium]